MHLIEIWFILNEFFKCRFLTCDKKSDFKHEESPFIACLWKLLTKNNGIIENNINNKKNILKFTAVVKFVKPT